MDGDGVAEGASPLSEAADWFSRLHSDDAVEENLAQFQHWLDSSPENASAYRRVCDSWSEVGRHASAPEIMAARRDALAVRSQTAGQIAHRVHAGILLLARTRSRRWALAVGAFVLAASFAIWVGSGWNWPAEVYSTGARERRTLTLVDGSSVTLDTGSRIRVRYARGQRRVTLDQGQAAFEVAKDPSRPFRIKARDETIVALGTQLNVDMIGREVTIGMIEGHVAVLTEKPPGSASLRPLELWTGEALRVENDGSAIFIPHLNVDHLVAWQSGHLAFDDEPLSRAADRVSHYSQQRIEVSPDVGTIGISGVFNVGDANAFVEAVTEYFPVKAIRADASTIYLARRNSADGPT